jgi:hypothetical protein
MHGAVRRYRASSGRGRRAEHRDRTAWKIELASQLAAPVFRGISPSETPRPAISSTCQETPLLASLQSITPNRGRNSRQAPSGRPPSCRAPSGPALPTDRSPGRTQPRHAIRRKAILPIAARGEGNAPGAAISRTKRSRIVVWRRNVEKNRGTLPTHAAPVFVASWINGAARVQSR